MEWEVKINREGNRGITPPLYNFFWGTVQEM